MFKKFNKQNVRFKTIFFCTSLNATRHHRCGNETKSDGFSFTEIYVSQVTSFSKSITSVEFCTSLYWCK